MLVLTRKLNETIRVECTGAEAGELIEVKVLGGSGNRVRLGITAGPAVKILRGELPVHESHGRDFKPAKKITTATKDGCD